MAVRGVLCWRAQGLRWVEEEITRLLGASAESQNTYFLPIVTIALNTGMRKNEILKLTWERVDFSRGVLQLAETKNGRRREVPMNRAVYDVLSNLPGKKEEGPGLPPEGRRSLG